jgi:D-psicose/D-tagatose/L-ribulose 3-epimerase
MHVSMHNWMRAEPIETTIARLAKCGYDAIEISGEPERYDTKHVRKLLADSGLRCWGSVTLMLADRDLLAKDEAQRAASVKYVTDTITMVKELGGEEITIVPSTVGKIKPQGSPDDEWQWAVGSLRQCYAHGLKEGSSSPSSRSTASRPTSSTATIRRWRSRRPSGPTAASASMCST